MSGRMPSTRVTLLAHAPTAATRTAAFPVDEPLDARGRAWAAAARGLLPRAGDMRCAPDRPSQETCTVLDLSPAVDGGLRGWDLGGWSGRTLEEVADERPDDVSAWLTDPTAAPHGGEPLAALLTRVEEWLTLVQPGHTLAVCAPAVARAAVVRVLRAPAEAFWRIDVAPLTVTDLRGGPRRWTVRATGARLTPGGGTV
jgi:broad specificity phosphatase PhoE